MTAAQLAVSVLLGKWCLVDERKGNMRLRIAAPENPDLDALVAAWLAQRYLCAGEPSEIVIFPRDRLWCEDGFTWRVEPSRIPNLFGFGWGRREQNFKERYSATATGHLWTHLLDMGKPVAHLVDLVDAVHQGPLMGGSMPINGPGTPMWDELRGVCEEAKQQADDLTIYQ